MTDTFQFLGFEPENSFKTLAKTTLWNLEQKAPSRSAKKAVISLKQDGQYVGELQFSNNSVSLCAKSTGNNPATVLTELTTKLSLKLEEWSKSRFSTD